MTHSIFPAIIKALRPKPKLPIDQWLKTHVRFERGHIIGPFDVANSPWIREPLNQIRENHVRSIICACSVQSAKTAFVEGAMLYIIAEEGGEMGTYLQTDDRAAVFLDKRFKHRIMDCKPVRELLLKGDRSIQKQTIDYAHMTQYVLGTANIHNVQSLALRVVIGDECAYWDEGRMDEVEKRTTSYDLRNSKRLFISTPLDNKGEFYRKFMAGSRSEWHVKCPHCDAGQKLVWRNMDWDSERARLEDGTYDLRIIKETTKYLCEYCKLPWRDDPITRRKIAASGYYVDENPAADPSVKSYHWNSLTVTWIEWHVIVAEFLNARHAQKLGDFTPMAEWTRKRLGEFFSPKDMLTDEIRLAGGFPMLTEWDQEVRRYLTVDVQKDYFRVICRLWALNGSSRLYFAGTMHTWEQIRDWQVVHKVTDGRVFVDCGYNTNEVLRQCSKYGWTAAKGDQTKFFTHHKAVAGGKTVAIQRPYSPFRAMDASIGLHTEEKQRLLRERGRRGLTANMVLWSSDYMKLILHRLRAGKGALWEIASDAPKFYLDEIGNEILTEEENKKTGRKKMFFKKLGPNHSFDAEAMQILGAAHDKLIGQAEVVKDGEESESEPVN